jgi:hypothetical protein
MTDERLALAELLAKAGDGDFLRSVAEGVLQLLVETDVDGLIGAGRMSAAASGRATATGIGTGRWIRGSAACSCASPSSARAAIFRPSSSPAGPRRRREWR